MYVFGYGSLMWNPGFQYEEKVCGYIKGFKRRFWQGSERFRGQPGKPGRVVSVFKSDEPNSFVHGVAFKIPKADEELVKQRLVERERGYDVIGTVFYPIDDSGCVKEEGIALEIFVSNESASLYLGPASERDIAWQIYHSKGINGSNLDYFLRLAYSYRKCFPSHSDFHLEQIEQEVCKIAAEKGDSLEQLIRQVQCYYQET